MEDDGFQVEFIIGECSECKRIYCCCPGKGWPQEYSDRMEKEYGRVKSVSLRRETRA